MSQPPAAVGPGFSRAAPGSPAMLVLATAFRRLGERRWPTALLLVMLAVRSGAAQELSFEAADRLVVASKLFALVQQHFAHWEAAAPADVEASYRQFVIDAIRSGSRAEFTRAALRFVASLRNGHTQLLDSQADGRPLKFRLLDMEGQWVVIASRQAELTRGTVVHAINGQPIDDFVREAARYVHASNDRLARTHVFSYPLLFPEKIALQAANGDLVVVDRSAPDSGPQTAPVRVSEGRWLSAQQVAYIRVPSFGDPLYEQTAVDLLRQYRDGTDARRRCERERRRDHTVEADRRADEPPVADMAGGRVARCRLGRTDGPADIHRS